jgi:hypothetical protein
MPLANLPSLSELTSIAGPVGTVVGAAAQTAANAVTGDSSSSVLPSWGGRAVVIILGLLLIAAGIFSFDSTRKLVVEGTKTAAKAAA